MTGPNLSQWALTHRSLIVYLMLILSLGGVISYVNLGRGEDPPFTIKTMLNLIPDTDVLENVCTENEKDRVHIKK